VVFAALTPRSCIIVTVRGPRSRVANAGAQPAEQQAHRNDALRGIRRRQRLIAVEQRISVSHRRLLGWLAEDIDSAGLRIRTSPERRSRISTTRRAAMRGPP
jgi:hypothetical protein